MTPELQSILQHAVQCHQSGQLGDAERGYRKVLEQLPDQPDANHLLGMLAHQAGHSDTACLLIENALRHAPDVVLYHKNLGNVYLSMSKPGEAEACYRRVIELDGSDADAINNLGNILADTGRYDEAEQSYKRAIEINPAYAGAFNNLGNLYLDRGRIEEAVTSFLRTLELDPGFSETYNNLGVARLALGERVEAQACFSKKLEMERGAQPIDPEHFSFRFISKPKIRHDIEQLRHLESVSDNPVHFAKLAEIYEALDQKIDWPAEENALVPLTNDQRAWISDSYNRPHHIAEAPEMDGSALNPDLDVERITKDYFDNAPGVAFFDGLFRPEALTSLRRYLMESTIWYDFRHRGGYMGAYLKDGIGCPLLFQIAEDLRTTFPDVFKDHQLNQLWAYKYDSRLTGIGMHADFAAVNVNFWVTPSDANLDPETGGLVVYKAEAPLDWDFKTYNTDEQRMHDFLEEHESDKIVVPHQQNRIVMFNSDLFHQTDTINFKSGYENRRINVTMLFGNRLD